MGKHLKTARIRLFLAFMIVGFSGSAAAMDHSYRYLLKVGSPMAALLGIVGIGLAGYLAGKSYDSYTGWERYTHGIGMFFNRKPFQRDRPTYGVTEQASRLNFEDSLFNRMVTIKSLVHPPDGGPPTWVPPMGIEKLPEPLKSYYEKNRETFPQTLKAFPLLEQQHANWKHFNIQFAVADAFSNASASCFEDHEGEIYPERLYPPEPQGPPEEWDFRGIRRKEPLPFKSPKHASELIKKVTHIFGATLVGITKLNPDWCYQGFLRGVGPGKYDVPKHWEYAIVIATPHEWDQLYANPTYGTTYDAYARERSIAGQLETFLHELGYPARSHVPPFFYDLVTPPVAVDAGLGEVGRNGLLITPELGCNARLAVITTNVPMEVDKPIDIGVTDFCRKCNICAKRCPSGAISHKDHPEVVRGYKRWHINDESCFHTWASVATSHARGCRVCLAVCPYTRKNNWLHSLARNIEPRDPTGIAASSLIWMQNSFFKYPAARDFLPPPMGKNATYGRPPDWLQTEKWFDVEKTW